MMGLEGNTNTAGKSIKLLVQVKIPCQEWTPNSDFQDRSYALDPLP